MKPKQSLSGYVREHLNALETRLENGVRQEVIVSELQVLGYEKTTLQTFRNLLYRARKNIELNPQRKEIEPAKIVLKEAPKEPVNPLKKASGFNYQGSSKTNPEDLF